MTYNFRYYFFHGKLMMITMTSSHVIQHMTYCGTPRREGHLIVSTLHSTTQFQQCPPRQKSSSTRPLDPCFLKTQGGRNCNQFPNWETRTHRFQMSKLFTHSGKKNVCLGVWLAIRVKKKFFFAVLHFPSRFIIDSWREFSYLDEENSEKGERSVF